MNNIGGIINSKLLAKFDIGLPVEADAGNIKLGNAKISRSIYPAFLLSILPHVLEFLKTLSIDGGRSARKA
jgi:hypothetical protein